LQYFATLSSAPTNTNPGFGGIYFCSEFSVIVINFEQNCYIKKFHLSRFTVSSIAQNDYSCGVECCECYGGSRNHPCLPVCGWLEGLPEGEELSAVHAEQEIVQVQARCLGRAAAKVQRQKVSGKRQ
jgi:hypothetical protein